MRRAPIFWAMVLILVGAILLLGNLGFLSVDAGKLIWPALLILVGIWFLLRPFTARRGSMRSETASIPLEGASRACVDIHHGAGRLTLDASAPAGQVASGTFVGGLDHRERREAEALSVDLRVPSGIVADFPWTWGPGAPLDWAIGLTREVPLALVIEGGASEARLDLTNLRVTDLTLKTGASSTSIQLPAAAGLTHVRIQAGAAAIALIVPTGTAGRFRVRGAISDVRIDPSRFPRSGGEYRSPDWDSAANKVDVELEMGVGSVDIR